jgi:hypothetical protein
LATSIASRHALTRVSRSRTSQRPGSETVSTLRAWREIALVSSAFAAATGTSAPLAAPARPSTS